MPLAMLPSYSLIVLLTLSACQLRVMGQKEAKIGDRTMFWRPVRAPMYLGYAMDIPRMSGRPNAPHAAAVASQLVDIAPTVNPTPQPRKVYHPVMRSRFFY